MSELKHPIYIVNKGTSEESIDKNRSNKTIKVKWMSRKQRNERITKT